METRDAVVVGGGPGGSSCAGALKRAGLDVLVLDRAAFPRDKICAGWITPQAVAALDLDLADYRGDGRTLQEIRAFQVSVIGRRPASAAYDTVVSYGIRRFEFDHYLLVRAGAAVHTEAVARLERRGGDWVVNGRIRTPLLVGAGGHFCPVARVLGRPTRGPSVVVAQEIEARLSEDQARRCRVSHDTPELYFCPDLAGYGWAFRKGDYLNVGFGRRDGASFPDQVQGFARTLSASGRLPDEWLSRWRGHAYAVYEGAEGGVVGDGVLLVGDAAGLAHAASGEGIGPAIESGLLAARAIVAAAGRRSRADLEPYRRALDARLGRPSVWDPARLLPARWRQALGRWLVETPPWNRDVVVGRWFLQRGQPPLSPMA